MSDKVLPIHMLTGSTRSIGIARELIDAIKDIQLDPMEVFGIIDALVSLVVFLSGKDHDQVLAHIVVRMEALKLVSKDSFIAAQISTEISSAIEKGDVDLERLKGILVRFKDKSQNGSHLN